MSFLSQKINGEDAVSNTEEWKVAEFGQMYFIIKVLDYLFE